MAEESAKMDIQSQGGVKLVTLADQKILDELSISEIGNKLNGLVAESKPPKIVINFANVTNMSSSALGMLITLHKRVREANGDLRLCNIQPSIEEVFKITRLNEVFDMKPSVDEAVDSIES
ncbi:MAG: anti-sigma factor antagonist [Planctomycetes bacterium]|jgi:anti-sigma B factor antagonist|nr:STAS domain-containing protein [Phycisphaerae bacterium]NBB94162.1 anti-sigma factor antagonist [Planctomycetota bacterium]